MYPVVQEYTKLTPICSQYIFQAILGTVFAMPPYKPLFIGASDNLVACPVSQRGMDVP